MAIHPILTQYQEIFAPVFSRLKFTPGKIFREGPRFFVVGGEYQGKKAIFKVVEINPLGQLLREDLSQKTRSRTKLVALTHVSNVLGTINPVEEPIPIVEGFVVNE